jgi:hypothetical protein
VLLNDTDYEVRFFRHTSLSGVTSYSLEIGFDPDDKMVIDDPSIGHLEQKLKEILPAALYTRMMATVTVH